MSLEGVTVRSVNQHTGEVMEMTGEQQIMDGMAAILGGHEAEGDDQAASDEAAIILQLYDEAVERVLAARKAAALLKIQAKHAAEEVELATEALLYIRRRYQVIKERQDAGEGGDGLGQLPLTDG